MPRFLVDIVICRTCNQQIEIWREEDTSQTTLHRNCAAMSYYRIVHVSKRLGVISSYDIDFKEQR